MYGTTVTGGASDAGTVFKLTHRGSGWLLTPLYSFEGGNDGSGPGGRVVIGPDGNLYGSTESGGYNGCCGTVFKLAPPAAATCKTPICPWTETVLYRFRGGSDGFQPFGDLVFDEAGDIYGATVQGGSRADGTVFKLTPSDGSWTESILYSFTGGNDGAEPNEVILDQAGNLYGTTFLDGAYDAGTIFELMPSAAGWTENTLYAFNPFNGDGGDSAAGLVFDKSGNLYGTTFQGIGNDGTVFELMPNGGGWTYTVLYAFPVEAGSPDAALIMDAAGSLYGTAAGFGDLSFGQVFKLTPSNGGWTFTSLHDFAGYEGFGPSCSVIFDAEGNLYGTAGDGGAYGYYGVV